MTVDVVQKLWSYCNTLRHDGMNYGDYIEQLTYLLFLKLADERGLDIPTEYKWSNFRSLQGEELLFQYRRLLKTLGQKKGVLKEIFTGAISKFREPNNFKKLIYLIDDVSWAALDIDIKGDAYEGLLQKYAAEQKGAGQYFTPRPVIRAVVQCIQPDFRASKDFTIHDPACGTGGFLIGAIEWILQNCQEKLSSSERRRLVQNTFSGIELVLETRRLALMNLYLHGIEADIRLKDSIASPDDGKRHDVILTNPPFGTKGVGEYPNRPDFPVATPNKQLNFVQHILTTLKDNRHYPDLRMT